MSDPVCNINICWNQWALFESWANFNSSAWLLHTASTEGELKILHKGERDCKIGLTGCCPCLSTKVLRVLEQWVREREKEFSLKSELNSSPFMNTVNISQPHHILESVVHRCGIQRQPDLLNYEIPNSQLIGLDGTSFSRKDLGLLP